MAALEGLELVTEETPWWPEGRAEELAYGVTKAMAGHTTWRAFYAAWFGVEVARRDPRSVSDRFRGRFATARARSELGCAPPRSCPEAIEETRRFLEERGLVAPSGA